MIGIGRRTDRLVKRGLHGGVMVAEPPVSHPHGYRSTESALTASVVSSFRVAG
jgi:hypothetical protein